MECDRLNHLAEKNGSIKSFQEYKVNYFNNINSWVK